MLKLATDDDECQCPDTSRGVFWAHAAPGWRCMVAISEGELRKRVEIAEKDVEPDETAKMRAWLNAHYPVADASA